jgi:alpha-galactosidase/6-phospho-beta-glucosidase family protein
MQVTIIGGGSYQWGPTLIADLLLTPCFADGGHLVLEDIDPLPLEKMQALATRMIEKLDVKTTVSSTTDQRRSLEGADHVVVTISTGGFESMSVDLDVPARHGIRQSVGDSVGPGGVSRSLRNIPVLVGLARDMEQICPDAWMLNITNPMSALTRSVCRQTSIKAVGLCHEVGNFNLDLAIALRLPDTAVRPTVTGVNHFPVITALEVDGRDGFEVMRELVDSLGGLDALAPDPERGELEPMSAIDWGVRNFLKLSMLDRWGVVPAAGDRHLAEFVPSILTEASGWGAAWGVELTAIADRVHSQDDYVSDVDRQLSGDEPLHTWMSGEMMALVIDSLTTGTRRELPINIPNAGQCPDLPAASVVESMCVVDRDGVRGRDQARAPAPVAELLRRHVATHELTVEAGVSGDRDLVLEALCLDPLAGRGDLHETESMATELLAGTARWLPQFGAPAATPT